MCAAAAASRPVYMAASTRSWKTHSACGAYGASTPGGLIAAALWNAVSKSSWPRAVRPRMWDA